MSDLHFIEKYCLDVQNIVGCAVVVNVLRGYNRDNRTWIRLTPDNVSVYEYAVAFSEEYQVVAVDHVPTPDNGYWNGVVSNFYMQYLPGCCGVCLSYHAAIQRKFFGKKLGTLTRRLREDIALAQGFTTLLSTAQAHNTPQTKIMKGSKRTIPIYSFRNARSGNEVIISACDLLKNSNSGGQTSTVPAKRPAEWDLEKPLAKSVRAA